MNLQDFTAIVQNQPNGVVLLEGRRAISTGDYAKATALGKSLALRFPRLRFRSGNAEGSDQAFFEGVALVDASRLQVIAPYASHRKSARHPNAIYDSPASLSSVREEEIAYITIKATPKNKELIEKRAQKGRLAAKAAYLIRDTMKVVGHSEDFPKPICALFYVDLKDPMAGGTGHTIRVCLQENVPLAFQDSWRNWPDEK